MPSVTCAECGHANGVEARFCEECGAALAPRCESCGAQVSPTARFCSSCGASLAEVPGAGGALKVVSVVFSDLVGSTALQEALEPESVRRVMTRYYEAMRAVVERHGGAVQKFIGDAVVAVFGVPSVSEDDAVRAVRCADAMTHALEKLGDELERTWGVRLQARTGVNTGELAVSDEGIFVGDTMNTAARLEQAAAAGQVLLGEATWRLVRNEIDLEEVASLELKGKAEPVRVWRVLSTQPRTATAAVTPLVGRTHELGRLQASFDEAVSSNVCRLVTVIGSPGLGKSRLAAEFARSLEGRAQVLEGHCERSGEGITFLPVADVLREAASIGEADAPDEVVAKLTAIVSDGPDRERVVARVAGLLGAGAPAAPEETFWGVRTMLESLARVRPLVVMLDDVHWGQPMFLDLIEHLVEWVRDAPILLVALARPELRETREALAAAGRRAVDVIELEPLGPDQSRELVGGLLGQVDLPEDLLRRIFDTSEGNPLFLGELLRMLVEEGSLEREDDVWVAVGGADAVQVPPTIQALLTARIERLRADERSVVERAAVIGKQFYRGAVAELVAPPVRLGIDGHLETLRRKDMVEPEGTYWIDEPVYRFHHVLIRDAAYHLLLKEARAELHERFAEWLETKAGELVGEHEEVIAYHLEQAHEYRRQLGPLDDRGMALGARAAQRLASAGRRALAREDLAAAANLLQRALEREAGTSESDILWALGEALLSAGDTGTASAVANRLSGPRGDVLAAQLAVLTGTGSLEQTLERVTTATAALAAAGDAAAEAKGHHVTAQVQAQLGRVADVETSLDRALLAARKADDRRRITAVLAAAPRAALWGPSPVVRASGRCLDVVRILRMTPGNRHVEAVALRCQAVLEAMRGRSDAAREILAGGRATLEELGLTLELQELAMHDGIVELLAGHPERAEVLLRSARDGFAQLGMSVSAAQAAALLARAIVDQGRDQEALAETDEAERQAGGDLKTTITWLGVRAEALARRGEVATALELAERAVALAEPTDALADKADANMALARVLREAGRLEEARSAAHTARGHYESKHHVVGIQRASELASAEAPDDRTVEDRGERVNIDDPEVAETLARFCEAWEKRDLDGLLAQCAPDWLWLDHRQLGQGEVRDPAADWRAILEGTREVRFCIDEVLACASRVVALRAAWRGVGADTGAEFELPVGLVVVVGNGRMRRTETFELDADVAIRACFEDLRGRALLGDRSPERLFASFVDAYSRRDMDAVAAAFSPDVEFMDRRQVGWEPLRGRDVLMEVPRSALRMSPDLRCVVDEVLACDECVLALRVRYVGSTYEGGGALEFAAGMVSVVHDGVVVTSEWLEHDDRDGMLARYLELGGTMDVLGDRPPEKLWAEFKRRVDAHDLDRLLELYADDWRFIDHRKLGMELAPGPAGAAELFRSAFAGSDDLRVDVEEVIACDERVIAVRGSYRGTSSEGGGAFEIPFAIVTVVEEGLIRSTDTFEPEDRFAIYARWRELHGLGLLGAHRAERLIARWIECYGTGDLDGLAEVVDDDYVFVDRRALGWEEERGREQHLNTVRSGKRMSLNLRQAVDEVLAADERLCVLRVTYLGVAADGGGEVEFPVGYVFEVGDNGLRRTEQFEHKDTEAMLSRYRELGGGPGPLGDRPPERVWARYIRSFNASDFDAFAGILATDYNFVDRRPLGYDAAEGVEGGIAMLRSARAASPELRLEANEVLACDDRVIAMTVSWRGRGLKAGELELPMGVVGVVERDRIEVHELFDPDDYGAIMTRYAELGGGGGPLGDRPPEQFFKRWLHLSAAHDVAALSELLAEDFVRIDHRSLGWEPIRGRQANVELWRSAWEAAAHLRMEVEEVLACDDRVIAWRFSWCGAANDGPGQFSLSVGQVNVIEDGRWVSCDQYEPDDREAMIRRYAELGGGTSALGDGPADDVRKAWVRSWGTRDFDRMAELLDEDSVLLDRRGLGWEEQRGRESWLQEARAAYAATTDVRVEVDEVLAREGNVMAMIISWRGTSAKDAGGGPFELTVGNVTVVRDGRFVRVEQFDPNDREGILTRFAELSHGEPRQPESTHFWRALQECWNAHDADRVADLFSEHIEILDRRTLGADPVHGRAAAREFYRAIFEMFPDTRQQLEEVIAQDDRVIAYRASLLGSSPDVGGAMGELFLGGVNVVQDGKVVRIELFEPDDTAEILRAYVACGGGTGPLGDRPPERWWKEWNRHFTAFDVAGLTAMYAEDAWLIDHRALGDLGDLRGRESILSIPLSTRGQSDTVRWEADEVLACDDRVCALRCGFRGRGIKVGDFDVSWVLVTVVEDGLLISIDTYDPDDREAALARYAELAAPQRAALGETPAERLVAEYLRLMESRDIEALRSILCDDVAVEDHRPVAAPPAVGIDSAVKLADSAFTVTSKLRFQIEEVLKRDRRAVALRGSWHGSAADGAGDMTLPMALVVSLKDDKVATLDLYDPDDAQAIEARFGELVGE